MSKTIKKRIRVFNHNFAQISNVEGQLVITEQRTIQTFTNRRPNDIDLPDGFTYIGATPQELIVEMPLSEFMAHGEVTEVVEDED